VPGFEAVGRYAVFGPAQMPQGIVGKLSTEIARYVQRPEVQDRLSKVGAEAVEGGAEELASFVAADYEKWLKVIKTAKIVGD
jgi:tripartite-type tricarboxylate transporter receptor subunit TctC